MDEKKITSRIQQNETVTLDEDIWIVCCALVKEFVYGAHQVCTKYRSLLAFGFSVIKMTDNVNVNFIVTLATTFGPKRNFIDFTH